MDIAIYKDAAGAIWASMRGTYTERGDWTRHQKDDVAALVDVVLRFGGTINISTGEPFCWKQARVKAAEDAKEKATF